MTLPNDDSRPELELQMRDEALNVAHEKMIQREICAEACGKARNQYLYIFEKTFKDLRRLRSDVSNIVEEAHDAARKGYDETFRTIYDTSFYEAFDVAYRKARADYLEDISRDENVSN